MTGARIINASRLGEARYASTAPLDLLLAELGTTFDRWVVLTAVASKSLPPQVGMLVPALSAVLDTTDEAVRGMLDDAEADSHIRVESAPTGDPAAARVELTAEGEVLHQRLRAAVDELSRERLAALDVRYGQ